MTFSLYGYPVRVVTLVTVMNRSSDRPEHQTLGGWCERHLVTTGLCCTGSGYQRTSRWLQHSFNHSVQHTQSHVNTVGDDHLEMTCGRLSDMRMKI